MTQTDESFVENDLFRAVDTNDMALLRRTLLTPSSSLNSPKKSPLLKSSVPRPEKLVNQQSPLRYNRTPLHIAVWNNNIEAAKLLIQAGADVNIQDDIKDSPFLLCGSEGRVEIMRLILDRAHTTRPNTTTVFNRYGGTALIPASERGHVEMVRLLLERRGSKYGGAGAEGEEYVFDMDINHMNFFDLTALIEVAMLGGDDSSHLAVARLLLEHGAEVNKADGEGHTTLYYAEQKNLTRLCAILKKAGGISF